DPAFEAERLALLRSRLTVATGWGTPLYTSFWFLDVLLAPDLKWYFLELRAGVIALFLTGIAIARVSRSSALVRAASLASLTASTLAIATMTFSMGGFTTTYYVGLTVPMYVVGMLLPWTLG